jgi:2-polyprenyl-3-methyl-5-hydroxy-6-metoxy-1,4-benzoquinol methylase
MQLNCPACDRTTLHRLLYAKNNCAVVKCSACGLGRAQCDKFDPREYYSGDYFSGGRVDGYVDYEGAEAVLRREFCHALEFIRRHQASGRLLEIGCAYGFFLQEAAPFYEVTGIEIAEEAAQSCRERGLRVMTGVPDERHLSQLEMMDVIVMLDVIEHLPDPRATLALCNRHLNPGGIILITTGDFGSLYARLAGSHWRLMTPPQHLWYFTAESLNRMSRSLGLTMEACDHPWKLVPLSLIGFQASRMLGVRYPRPLADIGVGIPVNFLDAMRCVIRKHH